MAKAITFYTGTSAEFSNLSSRDENGIYFITDTKSIWKGSTKYGVDNPSIATSTSVGVIKPGDDFEIATDGTLSLYTPIKINSFSNDKGTLETGTSVSSATFSWNVNKPVKSLKISWGQNTQDLGTVQNSSKLVNFPTAVTSNTSFILTAIDNKNKTATTTSNINFNYGRYYGVSTQTNATNINNTFVQGLTESLGGSRNITFTVTAGTGQYIYYAIPASYGTPSFFVGGFEGGFSLFKTFDFTNKSGAKVSYNVYKSTNANLGATKVEVK